MDIAIMFGGVIVGAIIGHLAVRWYLSRTAGRSRRAEDQRRAGLFALQLEYAGKVDPSLIETVAHSPHSVEEVRRILDDSIEMQRQTEELFGPGGSYQENMRRRWDGIL